MLEAAAVARLGAEAEGVMRRLLCLLLAGWRRPLHPSVKLEAALSGLRFAAAEGAVVVVVSPVDDEGVIYDGWGQEGSEE